MRRSLAFALAAALGACAGETGGGPAVDGTDPAMCPPVAKAVTPASLKARGAVVGTLTGRCMTAIATLYVGDVRATVVDRESKTLTFIAPAIRAGTWPLSYEYPSGTKNDLGVSMEYTALSPTFALAPTPLPIAAVDQRDAVVADFDNDGDLDIVIPIRGASTVSYLQNDGHAVFTDVTATKVTMPAIDGIGATAADVDGDGDVDVFVANFGGADVLLRNDQGMLVADAAAVPADTSADSATEFGDVDGDKDVDLIISAYAPDPNGHRQERVLLNDGHGLFTELAGAIPARDDQTPGITLGDVDGDGDLDAVASNDNPADVGVRLLYNNGNGTFVDAPGTAIPDLGLDARRAAFGDLDGDGDLDLVVAGTVTVDAYLNQGDGTYLWASTTLGFPTTAALWNGVAIADVDLDGDLDVVMSGQGVPLGLLLNNGDGTMTAAQDRIDATVRQGRMVVVADFNNDGAPDILNTDDGVTLISAIYLSNGE